MLYTPVPGTPLYQQMSEEGRMLRDVDYADVHGQFKFNFKHAAISRDDSKRFLDWAFWRDFEANGPSLYRISRTLLADGSATRIRPMSGFVCALPAKCTSSTASIARPCGRWNASSGQST
jgi:hypothetical protein